MHDSSLPDVHASSSPLGGLASSGGNIGKWRSKIKPTAFEFRRGYGYALGDIDRLAAQMYEERKITGETLVQVQKVVDTLAAKKEMKNARKKS